MARSLSAYEHDLDLISRKFIRRHAKEPPEGYASLSDLSADVAIAIDTLLTIDPDSAPSKTNTELWVRLLNDYVSYVEDWPYSTGVGESRQPSIDSIARVCGRLDICFVHRSQVFTQTQRTRLLSMALRLRQTTQQQLLTSTVDAFGESLDFNV